MDFSCPFLHIYTKVFFNVHIVFHFSYQVLIMHFQELILQLERQFRPRKSFFMPRGVCHFPSDNSALCEAERANIALSH